jgi:hypothetical protein
MQLAARIEARATRGTNGLAIQVLTDAQLSSARAAQHPLLVEFSRRPNPGGMACFQFVTVEAAIVCTAAVEFHRDDVEFAAVVRAARTPIYLESSYRYSCNRELHVTLPLHDLSKRLEETATFKESQDFTDVSVTPRVLAVKSFGVQIHSTEDRRIRHHSAARLSLAKTIPLKGGGGDF